MRQFVGLAGVVVACLLGSAVAQTPSPVPPPGPDVPTADCHDETGYYGIGGKLCLYKCANQGQTLTCSLIYTREVDKPFNYTTNSNDLKNIVLVDNYKENHPLVKEYYLDGRGKRQQKVVLDKGDYVWEIFEFGEGANDIKSARIVFSKGAGQLWFSLNGPVESAQ